MCWFHPQTHTRRIFIPFVLSSLGGSKRGRVRGAWVIVALVPQGFLWAKTFSQKASCAF